MEVYIKSPINYIGNKYKLIKQMIPLFPEKINTFVDVLGGSGTVLINTKAERYIYNDINQYVVSVFGGLINTNIDDAINKIESIIQKYNLNKTNKFGFESLRDDYNNGNNDWVTLYTLMCHSFNHQFRFNNKHQYNSSFGSIRAYFSDSQRQNLVELKNRFNNCDVRIMNNSFDDIDYSGFNENDLLYFDPPYFNSLGNYNDGKRGFEGWTLEHEKKLLKTLDELHSQGTRFALSNNLKYKNILLDEWRDKYKTHFLTGDYVNCNYQKIDRSKDFEVLITNY